MEYGRLDLAAARRLARGLAEAYAYEGDLDPILDLLAGHGRCMPRDTRTPLLACTLSVVDVLNGATGGEDVDLRALAKGRTIELPLPHGEPFFVAEKAGTKTFSLTPPKGSGTRGVGLLVVPYYGPEARFELRQGDLRVASRCAVLVTPRAFDAGRPFEIRVHHGAGRVHLGPTVTLRAP
jgi:hypothetical protein